MINNFAAEDTEGEEKIDINEIITMIKEAFSGTEYPGDWCLKGSTEGDEPYLLENEFKGKDDWTILDAEFLEQAPDGFGSALSFFSDEALHYYLPAYMIYDLQGEFEEIEVFQRLTHGLDDSSKNECINPRRYGNRTWYDEAIHKFSMFNKKEVTAIVAYLEFKKEYDEELLDYEKEEIQQALKNYWYGLR